MPSQADRDFQRISAAIAFIQQNHPSQPSLADIARHVHLSPAHFQRLFSQWAGTSPKKFLQFTSLEYAKKQLAESTNNLLETSLDLGLSSSSRLHDLFIQIEGMTQNEYRHGGKNLQLNYHYTDSPFGSVMIASSSKGICHLAFANDFADALAELSAKFPNAQLIKQSDPLQQRALTIFQPQHSLETIKLHLLGTDFQLAVWRSLLRIPFGQLSSYQAIANHINSPKACRAVGTAIGKNPVAFLIPCHRVIQKTGLLGGYRWGGARKAAILAFEAAKTGQK